jgi:hypothetical protein
MNRLGRVLLVIFAVASFAVAQKYYPHTDIMGGHNNNGRGCSGCHAPHSGARAAGGSIAGNSVAVGGSPQGDMRLWGQDLAPITAQTLTFGGGAYTVNFGGVQQLTSASNPLIAGIAVCLSCHDGNVSKSAMMAGQSYELNTALLPTGHGAGASQGALYGPMPIPTLLGNDGGTPGDYNNDHPVGPQATITAVAGFSAGSNLTYSVAGNTIKWTVAGQYASFVSNYGYPAVNAMVVDSVNRVPYVVCTTCHNQHMMNVYMSGAAGSAITNGIAGTPSGSTFPTFFYINAPYNPGATWTSTAAPSTTQFCRQCHFDLANESFGLTAVTTAF